MEEIKSPIFLEQFLEEKYHPNNLKDDFSSKKDAFIFTSMKPHSYWTGQTTQDGFLEN